MLLWSLAGVWCRRGTRTFCLLPVVKALAMVELTAWKTKLLSHLVGMEEAGILLGISLGHRSDFLHISYVCASQALKIEDSLYWTWSLVRASFSLPAPFTDILPTMVVLFEGLFQDVFKSRNSFSGKLWGEMCYFKGRESRVNPFLSEYFFSL